MQLNLDLPPAEHYTHDGSLNSLRINENLINELLAQKEIAIDTETTGLVRWKDIPLFWSLAWGNRRVCMPANTLSMLDKAGLFTNPERHWILANAKYDAHILANVGVNLQGKLVDTQVLHSLLYQDCDHDLKFMAGDVLGWKWRDFKETFRPKNYGLSNDASYQDVMLHAYQNDTFKLTEYASNDAYGTLKIYHKLREEAEREATFSLYPDIYGTMWDLFWKIEVPFTRVLYKCERRGVLIDTEYLATLAAPIRQRIDAILRELVREVGHMINPKSTDQLKEYFFGKLKLAPIKFTKGGKKGIKSPSVDEDFLDFYAHKVPAAKLLLEHRLYVKILDTYVEGMLKRLDPFSRLHCDLKQDVTRTGRLSARDPNMQNWPNADNDEFKLRGSVIAPPGMKMLVADYDMLEMKLLGAASGEQGMIEAFKAGKDIHMSNASLMYDVAYEDLVLAKKMDKKVKSGAASPEELTHYLHQCLNYRNDAKTIGFGLNYGMKAKKLASRLGCSEEDAQLKMDKYLDRLPAVRQFFQDAVDRARQTGYSFTVLGRRRYLPQIISSDNFSRYQAERQACNTEIQGSAAEVAKMAMIACDEARLEERYECFMNLQIHDELTFECNEQAIGDLENEYGAMAEVKEWMEHPFPTDLLVPLTASIGAGKSWLEAK